MIGCVSPSAVSVSLLCAGMVAGVSDGAHEAAAAIVQLHRQHFFERRAGQAALRERAAAEHEQAAAALGDEVGRHRELRAREEVAFDVRDDQRVVGDTAARAVRGKAGGERRRAAATRLHEERVLAVAVLALARHRVDFEPGSAVHARVMKLCSNPGAPSTTSSRAACGPAGLTSTLRALFSATASDSSRGISAV